MVVQKKAAKKKQYILVEKKIKVFKEKKRRKMEHKRKISIVRIDRKRSWINNLCECEDCAAVARVARGNFKRVCIENRNKLWSEERKEEEIKLAIIKNQKKLDRQIKNLKKKKKASNRYVSPSGSVWTVIEEE